MYAAGEKSKYRIYKNQLWKAELGLSWKDWILEQILLKLSFCMV